MGAKCTAGYVRAFDPLRTLSSPTSRKVARVSLVVCFLLFILSPLHWIMIDERYTSSSMRTESRTGLVVSAFRIENSFWQPRQFVYNSRRFPSPPPPVRFSPLFFSNNDSNMSSLSDSRRTSRYTNQYFYRKARHRNPRKPLFGGSSNDSNNEGESGGPLDKDSNGKNRKNRSPSIKRVGGRRRQPKRSEHDDIALENSSPSKNKLPSGSFLVVSLLVLTLLKNLLFGGGSDSDSYYYYSYSSSSVYETRVNPDGSRTATETYRKENSDLKTNIPGLSDKDFLDQRSNGGDATSNYFYFKE